MGSRGGIMRFAYVSLIPLPERGSIDLEDAALDESVGSDKLVVGGVVDLDSLAETGKHDFAWKWDIRHQSTWSCG
jgi:hypothetical protein